MIEIKSTSHFEHIGLENPWTMGATMKNELLNWGDISVSSQAENSGISKMPVFNRKEH
jgi:hypothetical protein